MPARHAVRRVSKSYPATGQRRCFDSDGREVPCAGTGQDAETARGLQAPVDRFRCHGDLVHDGLTGLEWTRAADLAGYPMPWQEAIAFVAGLNEREYLDRDDWRLPNRRELRSLMSHETRRPALPPGHPFVEVFQHWYWTSTSYAGAPSHAWCVHLEGARMFYGGKDQAYLVWPVRGAGNGLLAATGQRRCFDPAGHLCPCAGTTQDGAMRLGRRWPRARFVIEPEGVRDRLTDLLWWPEADLTGDVLDWAGALAAVAHLNSAHPARRWRLPNVNELESLVDCDRAAPALPEGHPFRRVRDGYWSSTTSCFEPDWAWALYLDKGAVGVGQKRGVHFHAWPVSDGEQTA